MDQLNIFDMLFPKYKILKPIRLIECFAGIGSQAKSLERLQKEFGFKFEHYRVIEFDKYAIASYNAINNTNFETSDITKIHAADLGIIETDKYDYIMTYSFPCQDLSLAGKRRGMDKNSGTRSGLLWEVERILDEIVSNNGELPQILLMENVPQVISSQNMDNFHLWQKKLEDLGYSNYVSLLNAKDYGIPQNRNRCFMISILGQYNYSFHKPFELKLKLKDMLEDEVDKRYYLSSEKIEYMRHTAYVSSSFDRVVHNEDGVCSTLCARDYKDPKCVEIKENKLANKRKLCDKMLEQGNLNEFDMIRHSYTRDRIDDISRKESTNGISATITTRADTLGIVIGDRAEISGRQLLKIPSGVAMIPEATKKGYAIARDGDGINLSYLSSKSRRGRVGKEISQALLCNDNNGVVEKNLRIRKLTPLECWRLMGFGDEDFYKAAKVNSNSQLYKQAGNSIVVNVLYYIFKGFFI